MNNLKFSTLLQKSLLIPPEKRNLGTNERIVSSAFGAFFCTLGMRRMGKGGMCMMLPAGYLMWRAASGYCPITEAMGLDSTEGTESFSMRMAVTIERPNDAVYKVWKDFEKLPEYLKHIKSVKKSGDDTYEWTADFNGQEFRWNAKIIEDVPNRRIIWRSVKPTDVENYGSVEFIDLPATGATRMRFLMIYRPAKTELGRAIAQVLTPWFRRKVKDDIRNFRDMLNVSG